ncbi:MAG TPA: hypothetical protein VGL26_00505 [Jatrophihabitans sp.]|jgi:hypothetical protein
MATVAVAQEISNLKQAMERARLIRDAEDHHRVGRDVDDILKFFQGWQCAPLRVNETDINEVFRTMGYERAFRGASWLARRADSWDTFLYWERAVARFMVDAEKEAEQRGVELDEAEIEEADKEEELGVIEHWIGGLRALFERIRQTLTHVRERSNRDWS